MGSRTGRHGSAGAPRARRRRARHGWGDPTSGRGRRRREGRRNTTSSAPGGRRRCGAGRPWSKDRVPAVGDELGAGVPVDGLVAEVGGERLVVLTGGPAPDGRPLGGDLAEALVLVAALEIGRAHV